jgi:aryl-alcohol dehydrogenase-like predicted oxidoreductase
MWAHQFAEALYTSDRFGLERFATMQSHYNPVYREAEREMFPLCEKEGIGLIPWSPLARGYVCRPHADIAATARGESDDRLETLPYQSGGGPEINERIEELADRHGVSMAQIALAWQFTKVDAPIVGVTSIDHLEDAVAALDVNLSESDVDYIDEPYQPFPVACIYNRPPDRHIKKDEV